MAYLFHPSDPNHIVQAKEQSSRYKRLLNEGYVNSDKHTKERKNKHDILIKSTRRTIDTLNTSLGELYLTDDEARLIAGCIRVLNNQIKRLSA